MSSHKEAFALMWYKCDTCRYLTQLWNSRDGVTPFCCGCVLDGCDGTMQHEFFGSDTPHPAIPDSASHVWIDMTLEAAIEWADKFWEAHGEKLMEQYPHLKEIGETELRKSKVEEIYHEGHAPNRVTRLEWLEMVQAMAAARRERSSTLCGND